MSHFWLYDPSKFTNSQDNKIPRWSLQNHGLGNAHYRLGLSHNLIPSVQAYTVASPAFFPVRQRPLGIRGGLRPQRSHATAPGALATAYSCGLRVL